MACSHKDGRQPPFKLSAGNRVDELDRGTAREASILQVGFPSRWTIRLVTPENAIDKVLDQHRDALFSFAESRNLDWENVEPVKQVPTKGAPGDRSLQVTVSGSNHSNGSPDGSSSADTLKLAFLQNTQQRDLGLGRKLPNFIKEDRAAFGQFKSAQSSLSCSRKGTLLMAKQF